MYFESETDIPKVRVESRHDVTFVKGEFENLLLKCMDNNVTIKESSISEEAQDALKKILSEELLKWSDQVWGDVGSNMLINGLNYEQVFGQPQKDGQSGKSSVLGGSKRSGYFKDCDVEPLDEKLQAEVKQLQRQADQLLLKVTKMRKEAYSDLQSNIARELERIEWVAEKGDYDLNFSNNSSPEIKDNRPSQNQDTQSSYGEGTPMNLQENQDHSTFELLGDKSRLAEGYYKALQKVDSSSLSMTATLTELKNLSSNIELLKKHVELGQELSINKDTTSMDTSNSKKAPYFITEKASKTSNNSVEKTQKNFEFILK